MNDGQSSCAAAALGGAPVLRGAGTLKQVALVAVPVLIGALVFLVPPAASAAPDSLAGTDDRDAVELLNRSATASTRVSYQGTQYVSAWSALTKSGSSSSAVVQVRHRAGGRTEIGVQDAQAEILTSQTGTSWLAEDEGSVDLLVRSYDIRLVGEAQVAGRRTDVVEARHADGSVAARWWLDQETALRLRREAFLPDGRLLSASAFVDVSIVSVPPCCMRSSVDHEAEATLAAEQTSSQDAPSPEKTALQWEDIERLRQEGFHCLESLGESLVLYEAREIGGAIQLSYSDGVMTASVFEQSGHLDPAQMSGYTSNQVGEGVVYTRPGPPATFVWSSQGRVVTVVADAPSEVIEDVLRALPPDAAELDEEHEGDVISRIGRGAKKVGSWLNPFG
ncbi:sigma-E factor regulatory protein RseB domain-containing protein [Phytoactinopolyspora halotolerans]|uniref:MucB/RseB N-terminal domain-containing protein n=1 Tax=Phytoactinopolyspora halotolerans TaxID=1981512 RepID=A0A6L9S4Z9_9ACTN|nr:sigma-E factor regulatory protein RseB domain-containing protein [Phytoactinopolyspora halotolerans]NEE00545.1 hypothetical protein [Phytoactinopolyspora halotolerans]